MPREGDRFDHERQQFYSPLSPVEQGRLTFLKWMINRVGSDDILADPSWASLPKMKGPMHVEGTTQIEYKVLNHFSGAPRPTKIALEAGHIYVDPSMSPLGAKDRAIALSGASLGSRIHDLLD